MNVVLWTLQLLLALMYVAGGAYKAFNVEELAGAMNGLPHGGWRAIGALEIVGGLLLVVPGLTGWMSQLTPLAAIVLTLETLLLAAFYARYSLALTAANPLVWAVAMALLVAVVAWGRYAPARAV